jgi:hypothetical protein
MHQAPRFTDEVPDTTFDDDAVQSRKRAQNVPSIGSTQALLEQLRYSLDRFASGRWTLFLPGVATALVRLALLPWLPIPFPATHDEFSYLLGADTFSHSRLTNPTHPLWRFFETIHVISIPTYASKYPPGQAFFLAIGERLFGHPFFGCVLACVLFVSAVVWMLRVWMPPGMALVGGFVTATAFGTGNYWLESYWGGAVAATGAALVLGAMGRIRAQRRFVMAWPFAGGIVLLWFTRPFEGAFLILAAGALLFFDVVRRRLPAGGNWSQSGLRSFIFVLAALGAGTLAFQAYYDSRVTGHVWLLPYLLHQQQYNYEPILWFQHPQTPTLDANPVVRKYHQQWEVEQYQERRNLLMGRQSWASEFEKGLTASELKERLKLLELIVAVVPILILSLLFWTDSGVKELWFVLFLSAVPLFLETFSFAHYMVGVTVTLIALIFRLIWLCHEPRWARSSTGTLVAAFLTTALFCGAAGNNIFRAWREVKAPFTFKIERARVQRELMAREGMQVVFVRYSPAHDTNVEWVYNGADIDGSKVVWARDLGPEQDKQLIDYYRGRHFWILTADSRHPEPVPYEP